MLMDFMQPIAAWSVDRCPDNQQITCILPIPHVHQGARGGAVG